MMKSHSARRLIAALTLAVLATPVAMTTGCSAPTPISNTETLRVESRRANQADWDALPASYKLREKINYDQKVGFLLMTNGEMSPILFEGMRHNRCADGVEYLCDDMNRNLWYRTRPEAPWILVLGDVRLTKTFGGCMPSLVVQYAGHERFIVAESLYGTEYGKGEDSGAQQITYLIDAKRGAVIARTEPQKYSTSPNLQIPGAWQKQYALPKMEKVDLADNRPPAEGP